MVVRVGGGPSPWCVADLHCSACLLVSFMMWSRSSGVNKAKNVVVGSPKGMDGPTGSNNSRTLTVQGMPDHHYLHDHYDYSPHYYCSLSSSEGDGDSVGMVTETGRLGTEVVTETECRTTGNGGGD